VTNNRAILNARILDRPLPREDPGAYGKEIAAALYLLYQLPKSCHGCAPRQTDRHRSLADQGRCQFP
jgi:hypothetical protein